MNFSIFHFRSYVCLGVFVLLFFTNHSAMAHGTLHDLLVGANAKIENDPDNAHLYYDRGELYREHEEWDRALADLQRSKQLDPTLTKVDFCYARVLYGSEFNHGAKAVLDHYLGRDPDDLAARILRAKVHVALEDPLLAIKDYDLVFKSKEHREPDDYLDCARVFVSMGEAHVEQGIATLDQGMKKLGPLISLQVYCIDLELSINRYPEALARVEGIMATANRKERWLVQRGDILVQAGQLEKAKSSYLESLKHIEKLPPSKRNTPGVLKLEESVQAKLKAFAQE